MLFFVNRAFYKLFKASGKDGVLETRESSSYYKEAVLRGTIFAENYEDSSKSIQYKILETNRKLLEENRHVIGVIITTI